MISAFGYTYPFTIRRFPTFNAPLLELVFQAHNSAQRPVRVVDIGAAVGDTVILLNANCGNLISEYVCIDGDSEFFEYQKANLAPIPNVKCILAQLSRDVRLSPSLVRIHAGTASAQGEPTAESAPLDAVLNTNLIGKVDVLKIDVDGFDGAVLAGAQTTLARDKPAIIFEWHPILCDHTGNSWAEAFEILETLDYSTFLWYDKYGAFSHFGIGYNRQSVAMMADYCLADISADWHFDIVALHDSSGIAIQGAAQLKFAKNRPSRR